jgi:serine/threonine protein kinase
MATLYQLLNVDPRASTDVVQAAFKALAAKYHPDRPTGDAKLFAEMSAARDILVDSGKRRDYDRTLRKDATKTGKTVIGSYEVIKFLAEGAMGRTYVVRHLLTNKLAVLKACLEVGPEHEEIMLNEARAIWDIRHYAFPSIREVMKLEDGAVAIVMTYVAGPTVEQAVKHLGPIEPEHVGWIFERLLAGLNYLHANGVIHGDIKPQNVVLQPESHGAIMIDFGLSMVKPTGKSHNIGFTNHFSPPEQLSADRKPLIPETDLYSLGMTMLYALTGKMATRNDPMPRNVPKELWNFIQRLTNPDIRLRPSWDTDLLRELGELRVKCFGSRNTRGKVFPSVPCDIIT